MTQRRSERERLEAAIREHQAEIEAAGPLNLLCADCTDENDARLDRKQAADRKLWAALSQQDGGGSSAG